MLQIGIYPFQNNAQRHHMFDNIFPLFLGHQQMDPPNQEDIDTRILQID